MAHERQKSEGQRLQSRLKWKSKGDQCLQEYFHAHLERSIASHITELVDEDGTIHTQQHDLERIC